MEAEPLVSLVILTRNRSDLIVRSVRSALGQTYRNTEVVVINDASDDDTLAVLDRHFGAEIASGKVRVVTNETPMGQARNRNASVDLARGELLAWLDDDDFWFPDKIEKQEAEMRRTGAAASTCGMIWMEGPRICKVTLVRNPRVSFENGGPPSTWLLRKDVIMAAGGFDPDLPANVDGEFLVRLNRRHDFCFVDEPLYVHFYFPETISASSKKKVDGWRKTIAKHRAILTPAETSSGYAKLAVFSAFSGEPYRAAAFRSLRARPSPKGLATAVLFLLPRFAVKRILNAVMDLQKYPRSYIGRYG